MRICTIIRIFMLMWNWLICHGVKKTVLLAVLCPSFRGILLYLKFVISFDWSRFGAFHSGYFAKGCFLGLWFPNDPGSFRFGIF